MLLSGLKRYVFHTQMRQFATFPMHTRTKVRKGAINQWTELKYSHSSNPILGVYRLFNSDSDRNASRISLPPLIRVFPMNISFFSFIEFFIVRLTIDKDFRLKDFVLGAKQAILVISHALAAQDYQALDGIVKDRTIKLLKGRVDRLNNVQRELIAVNPKILFFYFPANTSIRKNREKNEVIFEVDIYGLYAHEVDERPIRENISFCSYKFQRKYKDGIGGAWIVTMLNHMHAP